MARFRLSSTARGAACRPDSRTWAGLLAELVGVAARPRLPGTPPERRQHPDRHRAPPLGGEESPRQSSAILRPALQGRGGPGCRHPAPRTRTGSLGYRDRRPHPPARGPRLGDRGVPGRSVRAQRDRMGRARRRAPFPCFVAITPRTTITPSSTTRSTSTAPDRLIRAIGRSFDLFGDGSVRLVYTPGHSPGHTSVILRLPRRDFVVVGDAA